MVEWSNGTNYPTKGTPKNKIFIEEIPPTPLFKGGLRPLIPHFFIEIPQLIRASG
jgi:hypothetical protein